MLEGSCLDVYKDIAELKNRIESFGIGPLCLSGSGSALFYVSDDGSREKLSAYKGEIDQQVRCRSIIVNDSRW